MATTNKKAKGTKPKAPRPDVVLVKPTREDDLSGVTEFELFRCTIDGKPRVGLRVGKELLCWDKNGYPVRYPAVRSGEYAFLDYMTDEEGVYIPGSAEDRVIEEEHAMEAAFLPPMPDDPAQIDQIPDYVTYVWGSDLNKRDRYHARNFPCENGGRITLVFGFTPDGTMTDNTWAETRSYPGWRAFEIIDEPDPSRWLKHSLRKTHGAIMKE